MKHLLFETMRVAPMTQLDWTLSLAAITLLLILIARIVWKDEQKVKQKIKALS